jgi:hypothetical protein
MPGFFQSASASIQNLIHTRLRRDVTQATNILYIELVRRTSSGRYPEAITEAISTSPAQYEQGKGIVARIDIDLEKAPMALAFEYGSGIHSQHGSPQKYIIAPKDAQALAFDWNPEMEPWGSPKFIGKTESGKYLFRYVEHPGIAARPYLRPSIEAKADEIAELIGDGVIEVFSDALGPDMVVIR